LHFDLQLRVNFINGCDTMKETRLIKHDYVSILLYANAVLWGSSYVWAKMLLDFLPRFSILFLTSLGGLIALTIPFLREAGSLNLRIIGRCLVIGIFPVLSNISFMLALQYTTSANTAFIVQTSVIIVPVVMAVISRKLPQLQVVLGALTALTGLVLLTIDFDRFILKTGDVFALLNALFFSLYLIVLKLNSDRVNPVHYTYIQHVVNTAAFLGLALVLERGTVNPDEFKSPVLALLLGANIFVGVFTILSQSKALRHVKAERAAVIYTLEPVVTIALAYFLISERPDLKSLAGCVLVLAAVMLSRHKPRARKHALPAASGI